MKDGPNISRIASLIGERARADVLTALMADRALTATELAHVANVTKQTMSAHLAQLLDAGLISAAQQGRHRYFRLSGPDVAAALEALMGLAFRTGAVRVRSSPREPALRKARVCYDHLAGEMGVLAFDSLRAAAALELTPEGLLLTPSGVAWFDAWGVDTLGVQNQRRSVCRPCLDWGERRNHLGGALGAAMLQRVLTLNWAERAKDSRVMVFNPRGEQAFRALFKLTANSEGLGNSRLG